MCATNNLYTYKYVFCSRLPPDIPPPPHLLTLGVRLVGALLVHCLQTALERFQMVHTHIRIAHSADGFQVSDRRLAT